MGLYICQVGGGGGGEEHTACVLECALAAPTALTPSFSAYRLSAHCVPDRVLGPQTPGTPAPSLASYPQSPQKAEGSFFKTSSKSSHSPTQNLPLAFEASWSLSKKTPKAKP